MTWSEAGVIVAIITGVGSLIIAFRKAPFDMRGIQANTMKDLNASVTLANTRALEAEKELLAEKERFENTLAEERARFAKMHDEEVEATYLLTKRVKVLEEEVKNKNAMPYRIMLEVVLGTNPTGKMTSIEHVPERRVEEIPVVEERRSGL